MRKVSYLNDLSDAYRLEKNLLQGRCYSSYKNKPHDRWIEVMNAYNRKVIRKNRRSVGKSNKVGGRLTARVMCECLMEINMLAMVCRNNRAIAAKSAVAGATARIDDQDAHHEE